MCVPNIPKWFNFDYLKAANTLKWFELYNLSGPNTPNHIRL